MKPESKLWQWLRKQLRGATGFQSEFERIENRVGRSTPDIAFSMKVNPSMTGIHGWVELKSCGVSEARKKSGNVNVPSYTEGQKRWLQRRGKLGGRCYLFLELGDDIFLFGYQYAPQVGLVSWMDLQHNCLLYWPKAHFNVNQFLQCLSEDT